MTQFSKLKSILFITPYPKSVAPSQRFRFEQYLGLLVENDFTITEKSFWSEKGWALLYERGNLLAKIAAFMDGLFRRFTLLFSIHGFQYVFVHREALPVGPPLIEFIIAKILKKKIIYDFDDAIWLPNTSSQNSIVKGLKFHGKVKHICRWAWEVSCGNGFLADFASQYNPNICIMPTTIDTLYHLPTEKGVKNPQISIGWTGTHSTTKYLGTMVPLFQKLQEKFAINIIIISNQKPDWDFERYEFIKWEEEKEIEQLNKIDIGIMPLEDSSWEKGKCGFKALQYMALGIPAVASNVGANKTIISHGVDGFLCNSYEDWEFYLSELISDASLRKSIGDQGRQKVIDRYSVSANTDRFLSLFA